MLLSQMMSQQALESCSECPQAAPCLEMTQQPLLPKLHHASLLLICQGRQGGCCLSALDSALCSSSLKSSLMGKPVGNPMGNHMPKPRSTVLIRRGTRVRLPLLILQHASAKLDMPLQPVGLYNAHVFCQTLTSHRLHSPMNVIVA